MGIQRFYRFCEAPAPAENPPPVGVRGPKNQARFSSAADAVSGFFALHLAMTRCGCVRNDLGRGPRRCVHQPGSAEPFCNHRRHMAPSLSTERAMRALSGCRSPPVAFALVPQDVVGRQLGIVQAAHQRPDATVEYAFIGPLLDDRASHGNRRQDHAIRNARAMRVSASRVAKLPPSFEAPSSGSAAR